MILKRDKQKQILSTLPIGDAVTPSFRNGQVGGAEFQLSLILMPQLIN